MKILSVVGARPNFMKMAPLLEEMGRYPQIQPLLVHTGQHYDRQMSALFFEELGLPRPDIDLGVGSGSHALQTAEVMRRIEPILLREQTQLVLVVGDVNSTLAAALTSAKLGLPVAHVEAGLRSFDRSMPEEINRVLTDALSDLLFTTEQSANENLLREGIPPQKIHFVGNVMIDSLLKGRERARESPILQRLGLSANEKGNGACPALPSRPSGLPGSYKPGKSFSRTQMNADFQDFICEGSKSLCVNLRPISTSCSSWARPGWS